MADYTIEELQQMLDDKMQAEFTGSQNNTDILLEEIYGSNDLTQSIFRDLSKGNNIIYSWVQSDTVGKRVVEWFEYSSHNHPTTGETYYTLMNVSQSVSTNLSETYTKNGIIIKE